MTPGALVQRRRLQETGPGRSAFLVVNTVVLGVLILIILLPIWMVVATSIASDSSSVAKPRQ